MKRFTIFLIAFFVWIGTNAMAVEEEEYEEYEEILETINNTPMKILSKSAILYDRKFDKILYEKNINEKLPNASTTKILTAIVAYENADMNDIVTISDNAAKVGGSTIHLRKGNQVMLGDLMKGLLICSGNDAAVAIAEHVGGNIETFCNMMNQKAFEIGAKNTHFVTPHGLDEDEHYSTAWDLCLMANYLLTIPYLSEIVDTSYTTIKVDNNVQELRTTNEMLGIYESAKGIKTGYTSKAGRCLITAIESGDRELITVVLGCDTKKQRTLETMWLIQYGFSEFEIVDLYARMKKSFYIPIEKSSINSFELNITEHSYDIIHKGEENEITYEYNLKSNLIAPLHKNTIIGKVKIRLKENVIQTVDLKVPYDIKRSTIFEYMTHILKNQLTYITIQT